jgi:hypothetical protein
MRGGWQEERDGSFFIGSSSRKVKPPPATPWEKLAEEWRMKVSPDFHWKGRLSEVLRAAAETNARARGKLKPCPSSEAFLVGWAKAHRWTVDFDTVNDLVTIRPAPGKLPPIRNTPQSDSIQPSLFDFDQTDGGTTLANDPACSSPQPSLGVIPEELA